MKRESNAPKVVGKEHIGLRVLYRLANQVIVSEGVIDGLSPEGAYVKVGRHWLENGGGAILSVLKGSQRRREAIR